MSYRGWAIYRFQDIYTEGNVLRIELSIEKYPSTYEVLLVSTKEGIDLINLATYNSFCGVVKGRHIRVTDEDIKKNINTENLHKVEKIANNLEEYYEKKINQMDNILNCTTRST